MAYSYEPHHFEDFEEGQEFTSVGRTVTETDFVMHSALSGDWTELHTNKEYAAEQADFDGRIAHGPMTFVQATGFVYRSGIVERTALAFLGMNYMDLPNPVYIGDTLQLEMVVTKTKEVGRDDAGLVVIDTEMENQDGTTVLEGDMKFLIKKE